MQISQETLGDELTWSGIPRTGIRHTSKKQQQPHVGAAMHIRADHQGKAAGGRLSWQEAVVDGVDNWWAKFHETHKDAQQHAQVQSSHETKSSVHACIACQLRNCRVGGLAERQAGSWGWQSKKQAQVVDLGCTAGLQPDKEPGTWRLIWVKTRDKAVNQTTNLSSTVTTGQGRW